MKTPNVVAVTEHIPRAGTILMWTLSGATDLDALRGAFGSHGIDEAHLPLAPSPATAMRRAVGELRAKDRIVHAIGRGAGYVLVDVVRGAATMSQAFGVGFDPRAKFSLNAVGHLVVEGGTPAMQEEVRTAFEKHLSTLSTEDVSSWLVHLSRSLLDGVAMKGGGGVYFIPYEKLPDLDAFVLALRACSEHAIYRIPAMAGDDAVQAILDAIETEADAEAQKLEEALTENKFGARGLETRICYADNIALKVERYERLLGAKIEGLRERLGKLSADLTVAMIKSRQAEAAERGERSSLAI